MEKQGWTARQQKTLRVTPHGNNAIGMSGGPSQTMQITMLASRLAREVRPGTTYGPKRTALHSPTPEKSVTGIKFMTP